MLRKQEFHNLAVVIEHSATGKMGGIGSYNSEVGKLSDDLVFLLIDDEAEHSPADNILLCRQYVNDNLPELKELYDQYASRGYVVLRVVQELLKQYPSIKNIDTHEYSGIASRVAEACRVGLLGSGVRVRTHCHGGHVQLERATGEWGGKDAIAVNSFERSVMENADELWFSSKYLMNLYRTAGISVALSKTHVLGLPYELHNPSGKKTLDYTNIKHLVFVGRMNRLKGYEIFTEVVEHLLSIKGFASQLETVFAIGKDDGSMPEQTARLRSLAKKHNFDFTQTLMTRTGVIEFETSHAHDSLFILPYMSDNYSVAMLELVEAKAPIIGLDTGGNIELVDHKIWHGRLALDSKGLCKIAERYVSMTGRGRMDECQELYRAFYSLQSQRNQLNAARLNEFVNAATARSQPTVVQLLLSDSPSSGGLVLDPTTMSIWVNGKKSDVSGLKKATDNRFVFVIDGARKPQNTDEILEALGRAIDRNGRGVALSVGMKGRDSNYHIPSYIDIGLLAVSPQEAFLRNLCMPSELLFDYIELYRSAASGGVRRSADYFLAGLSYFMAAGEIVVIPMPTLLEVSYAGTHNLVIEEALFVDLAQFAQEKKWVNYRYLSLVRNSSTVVNASQDTQDSMPYIRGYVDLLARTARGTGIVSKVVRGGVKMQMKFLGLLLRAKKRVF